MKRLAVLTLAGLYLGLSNFCLSYAIITGEAHHAVGAEGQVAPQAQAGAEHDHEHHHHEDSEPAHHDHGSEPSDACCAPFNDQALVPSGRYQLSAGLQIGKLLHLELPATAGLATFDIVSKRSDHGPPESPPQVPLLPSSSPRAPPALA